MNELLTVACEDSRERAGRRPATSGRATAIPEIFRWRFESRTFDVAFDRFGSGPHALFLPAMSTVSTRAEWRTVAKALADEFAVTLLDWPGFGEFSRGRAAYSPVLYHAFLRDFVRAQFSEPVAVLAAGHAAGYVVRVAAAGDVSWRRAVMAAPTWRGPLPTAMGEHRMRYAALRRLVEMPVLGHVLYRLNTTEWFLRRMFGRHVFADESFLTPELFAEKQRVARQSGARFAASAFVTGALDPFPDRASCFRALQGARFPVLLALGEQTPPKSRAEMAALAGACPRPPLILRGSLGLHEECADELIALVREFLSKDFSL